MQYTKRCKIKQKIDGKTKQSYAIEVLITGLDIVAYYFVFLNVDMLNSSDCRLKYHCSIALE